jgi:hypothetical protein
LRAISTTAARTYDLPNASGTIALTSDFASPPAIGNTTPAAISGTTGTFTTLTANTSLTLNGTGAAELVNAGAAAGPLRIYNTFTSSTNHERGFLRWSSNVFQIGTEKGSGSPGGTARALEFQTDGATRMTIGATGTVTVAANATNALTISGSNDFGFNGTFLQNTSGGSSASTGFTAQNNQTAQLLTRVYSSGVTGISVWGTTLANRTAVFSDGASSLGMFVGTLNATPIIFGTSTSEKMRITSGGLVTFGGTTGSFPALKRDSATLQVRLADDTAYSVLDAQLRSQGTAPATAAATGTAGDIRYDAGYIYVATATNTWKRAAIATW